MTSDEAKNKACPLMGGVQCEADNCMAWRGDESDGFCGLAGMPVEVVGNWGADAEMSTWAPIRGDMPK